MTQPRYPLVRPRMHRSGEDPGPRDGFTLYTLWHYEMQPAEGHVCDLVWARTQAEALDTLHERYPGLMGAIHIFPVATARSEPTDEQMRCGYCLYGPPALCTCGTCDVEADE